MLDKALENMKYDTRLVDYNLNNGFIKKEDYQKHLSQLPDLAAQAVTIEIEGKQTDEDSTH